MSQLHVQTEQIFLGTLIRLVSRQARVIFHYCTSAYSVQPRITMAATFAQEEEAILKKIGIAVSSRGLFNFDREHAQYSFHDADTFQDMQKAYKWMPVNPGGYFSFVKAAFAVNDRLKELDEHEEELFDVVLLSHNEVPAGSRLLTSIARNDLPIRRFALIDGSNPVPFLKAFNISLFLTTAKEDAECTAKGGYATAIMCSAFSDSSNAKELCIAFDVDAIQKPALKIFLEALGRMQQKFLRIGKSSPIRIYVIRQGTTGEIQGLPVLVDGQLSSITELSPTEVSLYFTGSPPANIKSDIIVAHLLEVPK